MSYHSEIFLGLALGGTLLWWWKTSEDEKLRKQELEHRQYIQNLAISQDFSRIITLDQDDYTLLLTFLSPFDAETMRTKKQNYEHQIRLEAAEKERQAAIERERLRIEENRKRQVRMMEMADNFDTDIIKHLNNADFSELTKYLEPHKLALASAVRTTYQSEMRLKREADALHAETERLRLERIRLEQEREHNRHNEILRTKINNYSDYLTGLDKGQIDGLDGNHAANSWDWFFTSSEFKQGYEIGYRKSRQQREKSLNVVFVNNEKSRINSRIDSRIDSRIEQKVAKASEEIKNQIDQAVEKIGEEINKAKESETIYDMSHLVSPYKTKESEQESESESEPEPEPESESEIEKQMQVLDMMMHN